MQICVDYLRRRHSSNSSILNFNLLWIISDNWNKRPDSSSALSTPASLWCMSTSEMVLTLAFGHFFTHQLDLKNIHTACRWLVVNIKFVILSWNKMIDSTLPPVSCRDVSHHNHHHQWVLLPSVDTLSCCWCRCAAADCETCKQPTVRP